MISNTEDNLSVKYFSNLQDYKAIWHAMKNFTQNRSNQTIDELWLLQHHPVFTLGQAGNASHILNPGNIPVIKVDRGGQVTYHGPGQLVAYPMIDIRRRNIGIRNFVQLLEQMIINIIRLTNNKATRKEGAPGVYVNSKKIASIGLRVSRGCTYHGLAFNIDMDLYPFQLINPCGFKDLEVIDLKSIAPSTNIDEITNLLVNEFTNQLNYKKIILSE